MCLPSECAYSRTYPSLPPHTRCFLHRVPAHTPSPTTNPSWGKVSPPLPLPPLHPRLTPSPRGQLSQAAARVHPQGQGLRLIQGQHRIQESWCSLIHSAITRKAGSETSLCPQLVSRISKISDPRAMMKINRDGKCWAGWAVRP